MLVVVLLLPLSLPMYDGEFDYGGGGDGCGGPAAAAVAAAAAVEAVEDNVTKIGYFGTYLRYLPTNPTSRHCDNIPANPSWIVDISQYHSGHSTSSSTVE